MLLNRIAIASLVAATFGFPAAALLPVGSGDLAPRRVAVAPARTVAAPAVTAPAR
jgi:hypothetical protein